MMVFQEREFKATPLPDFDHTGLPEKVQRPCTDPKPFNFLSESFIEYNKSKLQEKVRRKLLSIAMTLHKLLLQNYRLKKEREKRRKKENSKLRSLPLYTRSHLLRRLIQSPSMTSATLM